MRHVHIFALSIALMPLTCWCDFGLSYKCMANVYEVDAMFIDIYLWYFCDLISFIH